MAFYGFLASFLFAPFFELLPYIVPVHTYVRYTLRASQAKPVGYGKNKSDFSEVRKLPLVPISALLCLGKTFFHHAS